VSTGASPRRKLSAIVAVYRDALAVPDMHARLAAVFQKLGVDYEILFVNDASPDDAREVLAHLAATDPHVVVINHTRNFGSQSAFTSGMALAAGDAVILLDGDLQDPPELIEQFHEKWLEGYDVVYGERVQREASWFMRWAYKVFYRIFQRLSYVRVPVDAGDFSLIDRRVVTALNALPRRTASCAGCARGSGTARSACRTPGPNVPMARHELAVEESRLGTQSHRLVLVRTARPDHGAVADHRRAVGDLRGGLDRAAYHQPRHCAKGVTTLLIVILFLGGVQLLCLGIIGSYLAHVYDEVKRRPAYIVDSVVRNGEETRLPVSAEPAEVAVPPNDGS